MHCECNCRYAKGPWHLTDPVLASSPVARTVHPVNKFEQHDLMLEQEVKERSKEDLPLGFDSTFEEQQQQQQQQQQRKDPYFKEPASCVLCPRRYRDPVPVDYKNPKLLAQFVSPHTGLMYKSHITGLCAEMQQKVEREVIKAQRYGFLATKMKELQYIKDPPLFNPGKPIKRNPY